MKQQNNNKIFVVLLILSFVLICWIISIKYPGYLFKKKISINNIEVYYNHNLDTLTLKKLVSDINQKLKKSKWYNSNTRRIYFCNNRFKYSFLSPFNFNGLASNYVNKNNIFIASANTHNNKSISLFRDYSEDLDKLMTHEITHSLLNDKGFHKIDTWKNEGYCEYIAYDQNVNLFKDYQFFLETNDIYIKYRIVFFFLISEKQMTPEEIFTTELDFNSVYRELVLALQK